MRNFCTFTVGNFKFGVDVLKILAILHSAEMVRVPLANRAVAGLIQHRGQIITVIDLRKKFDFPDRETDQFFHTIVRTKRGVVSLLVDKVEEIEEVTQNARVEMSKPVHGIDSFFISYTYRFEDYTLLILDVDKVVEVKSN